jgi:hypothetical protein
MKNFLCYFFTGLIVAGIGILIACQVYRIAVSPAAPHSNIYLITYYAGNSDGTAMGCIRATNNACTDMFLGGIQDRVKREHPTTSTVIILSVIKLENEP